MGAQLRQRPTAQTVVDNQGDYLMIVKENQPQLLADIETLFQEPQVVTETLTPARTIESGMAASTNAA
jgi:hypothetical protein